MGVILTLTLFLSISRGDNLASTAESNPPVSGQIIDSVEIGAENVFDLTEPRYNNFLFRLANKTHIVTRKSVIRRELLLGPGDIFDTALVNESIRNLRRLPYLFKTDITMKEGDRGENIMVVNTSDKWTIVGGLSFHRTGGRDDLQIGLEENNLLGQGIFLSNDYMILENDRDFYQIELSEKRFMGKGLALGFFYSDNPRAGQISMFLGRPFYSLSQNFSGEIRFLRLNNRLDYYPSGSLAAQDRYRKRRLQLTMAYRNGPCHVKYRITTKYEYSDLESTGLNVYDSTAFTILPTASDDSLFHYFQGSLRIRQIKYVVFNRLNRFHKVEDVNLGLDAQVSYGQAQQPGFHGPVYHYMAYWPQYTVAFNRQLLIFGIHHEVWYSGSSCLREKVNLYFKGYSQVNYNNTIALGVRFHSHRLRDKYFTLYLDEDNGLRGYPAYLYNGEDRLIINIENRFFSDLEIFSVGVGGAVFADIGSIWARDSRLTLSETRSAVGMGLRFGISRSTQGEVLRVDLAYAVDRKSWQLSVGTGQFF